MVEGAVHLKPRALFADNGCVKLSFVNKHSLTQSVQGNCCSEVHLDFFLLQMVLKKKLVELHNQSERTSQMMTKVKTNQSQAAVSGGQQNACRLLGVYWPRRGVGACAPVTVAVVLRLWWQEKM